MTQRIINLVPRHIRSKLKRKLQLPKHLWNLLINVHYDTKNYVQASTLQAWDLSKDQLSARLTADYHKLEKGLTLNRAPSGFGLPTARCLLDNLREYVQRFGPDPLTRIVAVSYTHLTLPTKA